MATGNMKDIKRRIKSVGSTMQITKAMELVASSKLRRGRKKAKNARPYFEEQTRMLVEISRSHNIETVFTEHRDSAKRELYIVIAGDRGLAGGYNSGIFKRVAEAHAGKEKPKIIAIGKKAVEYFEKREYDVILKYPGLAENVKSGYCSEIAKAAIDLFVKGEKEKGTDNQYIKNTKIDEVKLFYTKFVSTLTQEIEVMPLLPMPLCHTEIGGPFREGVEKIKKPKEINYDPTPEAVFNRVVPCFLMSIIQCAITESYASEQCARRLAMESASDNAEEMIDNLSLLYNRARQEKITNEINEIVGGANAL
jgi:F-type H+-transporting ATPase subunit gamma